MFGEDEKHEGDTNRHKEGGNRGMLDKEVSARGRVIDSVKSAKGKSDGGVIYIVKSAKGMGAKCGSLLAVHALTGCDSVSYPFGKSKTSA